MIGALVIGFVGSLHCVGMCGPLNLFVLRNNGSVSAFGKYHAGRIFSYMLLGVLLGAIGTTIRLVQLQQVATFVLGFGLLVIYSLPQARAKLDRFYYQSFILPKHQGKTYQKSWIDRQVGGEWYSEWLSTMRIDLCCSGQCADTR